MNRSAEIEAAACLALDALNFDAGNWNQESIERHLREQIELAKGHLQNALGDGVYVVVCERDTRIPDDDSRPIVFEQFIDQDSATLESVQIQQVRLGDRYGKTRIARLVFLEAGTGSQEVNQ